MHQDALNITCDFPQRHPRHMGRGIHAMYVKSDTKTSFCVYRLARTKQTIKITIFTTVFYCVISLTGVVSLVIAAHVRKWLVM